MLSSQSRFRTCTLALFGVLIIAQTAAAQRVADTVDAADYFSDYGRGLALYTDGRNAEAARMLSDLAVRNPDDASIWYRLGRSREHLDQAAAAIGAYRAALDLGYRYTPWIAYRVARLYAERNLQDSSFVWLERALEHGYDDRSGIAGDPAFESLQTDPRFARFAGLPPKRHLTRDEGWQYDVDFLVAEAQRMHAGRG